jgi:RND family efflux transporter MFP subunit
MEKKPDQKKPFLAEHKTSMIFIVVIVILIGSAIGYGIVKRLIISKMVTKMMASQQPPAVDVQKPTVRDVPAYYDFTATAKAVDKVMIQARVKGYLQQILFQDGAFVEKGQVLFKIEDDTYIALRDQAKAQLKSAKAELKSAQADLDRVQAAVKTNAVSEQQLTRSIAQRDKAKAAVTSAAAKLNDAKLNLSYTNVTSPITGRISRHFVDKGNLVGAGEHTLLAEVVKLEPIYVYFYVSESLFHEHLSYDLIKENIDRKFQLSLNNQNDFSYSGKLNYIDNTVDNMTGTILVRGALQNKQHKILPGMYTRLRLSLGVKKNALLVPEKAVKSDIGGKYLFLLDDDNVVRRRNIEVSRLVDSMRIVEAGLTPDDRFVIEGTQYVTPGAKVEINTQSSENNKKTDSAESKKN